MPKINELPELLTLTHEDLIPIHDYETNVTKAVKMETVFNNLKPGTLFVSKTKIADYTEISDAVNALPSTGGVIFVDSILVGTDTPYEGFTVNKNGVVIIGTAPAEYDSVTNAPIGNGVVIDGKVTVNADNFTLKNVTIWAGTTADDCVVGSGNYINHHYENLVCIGDSPTSAYHSLLVEGLDGVSVLNCKVYNNVHGFAIKSSNVVMDNCTADDNAFENLIIKADNAKTYNDIQVTNFIGKQNSIITNSGNIVVHSTGIGSVLKNVTIKNAYVYNSDAIAVELKLDNTTAVFRNITLDNVVADEFRAYGFWIYGVSGGQVGDNISFINCVSDSTKITSSTVGYANGNNDLYMATNCRRINCTSNAVTKVLGRFIESGKDYFTVSAKDKSSTHTTVQSAISSSNTKGQGVIFVDSVLETDSAFATITPNINYVHLKGRNPGIINWTTKAVKGDSSRIAGNLQSSVGNTVYENLTIIVTSGLNCFFFNNSAYENVTFKNCNFVGYTSSSAVASVKTQYCDYISFIDCKFLYTAKGLEINSSNVLVQRCEFGFHNSAAIDVISSGSTNSTIRILDNTIRGNSTDGAGIIVSSSSTKVLQDVIISGNTITGAKGIGIQVQSTGTTKNVNINNNIISGCVSDGIRTIGGTGIVVANNILRENGGYGINNTGATVIGGGNTYDNNTLGATSGTIGAF